MVPLLPVLRKTEIVLLPSFVTAKSALPSPSRSPMATEKGVVPVVKSTLALKSVVVMSPLLGVKVGVKLLLE